MIPDYAFYLSFFLFSGIPLIILFVGFVLFLVKFKIRRKTGVILIVLGGLELSVWLLLTKSLMFNGILVFVATIFLGIISLYYSSIAIKN